MYDWEKQLEEEREAGRCTDMGCTRMNGRCIGYHCPYCGKPCSSQGHLACVEEARNARV